MDMSTGSFPILNMPNQNEKRLPAVFFWEAVENKSKSAAEGHPIFDNVPYIRIFNPADRTTEVIREVKEKDKANYPREWAAFQQHGDEAYVGTPLEHVLWLNKGQVRELQAMGIRTLEHLAELDDRNGFMGWRDLRNKAKAHLQIASDQAAATKWEEEKKALTTRIDVLAEQNATLIGQVSALMAKLNGDTPAPVTAAAPIVPTPSVTASTATPSAGASASLDAMLSKASAETVTPAPAGQPSRVSTERRQLRLKDQG